MPQFLLHPEDVVPAVGRAVLRGAEAHHLVRVHRARRGQGVDVFDGRGNRWRGTLESVGPSEAVLVDLKALPSNEPPGEVWLVQSLPKGDRWSWLLAKGTELGVTRFLPVRSERTVAGADRDHDEGRASRWAALAAAAAKQCERGAIPRVAALAPLAECVERLGPPSAGEVRLWLAERGEPGDLPRGGPAVRVILAVGPEGGWTPGERSLFRGAGFGELTLGPRILRAETAALASVALAQSLWGDLVDRRPLT